MINYYIFQMGVFKNLAIIAGILAVASAHSYHMGSCPIVEPMQNFQMSKVSN